MTAFIHARVFDTRWGQALAFLDHDDAYETEVLTLRIWAPVGEEGALGVVDAKVGLQGDVSDKAADAMEAANRSALAEMDVARFEAGLTAILGADLADRLAGGIA